MDSGIVVIDQVGDSKFGLELGSGLELGGGLELEGALELGGGHEFTKRPRIAVWPGTVNFAVFVSEVKAQHIHTWKNGWNDD